MRNDPLLGRRGAETIDGRAMAVDAARPSKRWWAGLVAIGVVLAKLHFVVPLLVQVPAWFLHVQEQHAAITPRSVDAAELGNVASWIRPEDYPAASIRAGEEGTVEVAWTRMPDGHIGECHVVADHGHPRLAAAACGAVMQRGGYPPLSRGATPVVVAQRVRWQMPHSLP